MKNKLGLKPVQTQPIVRLADYATPTLPTVDQLTFPIGHPDLITPEMFLNDRLGDCAEVAAIEFFRLLNATRDVTVNFTDATAEQAYTEITGYNPADPSTDAGTDVHVLFDFLKATGIADADGNRHKVIGYAGLPPGDWEAMLVALSLFEVVIIGVQVTDYAERQFEDGQPWALLPGRHSILGGHCIPITGATDLNTAQDYTWAAVGGITAPYYRALNTVAVVAITEDMFAADNTTLDHIDRDRLAADLGFYTGPVLSKAPRSKARAAKGEHVFTHDEVVEAAPTLGVDFTPPSE